MSRVHIITVILDSCYMYVTSNDRESSNLRRELEEVELQKPICMISINFHILEKKEIKRLFLALFFVS